jgi:hypothetical protein
MNRPQSRVVRVGAYLRNRKLVTDQLITTSSETDINGVTTEHVTLETPRAISETQRMRLLQTWEQGRAWKT